MTTQTATPILPDNPPQAVQEMIRITTAVLDLAHREAQAIARNDAMDFTAIQDEKNALAQRYAAAGQEFRRRIEDFRGTPTVLLDRLGALQTELGEVTAANNAVLGPMIERARARMGVVRDDEE